jgi:tripartite-type tricarboxylate transporter receptor subunit TctC
MCLGAACTTKALAQSYPERPVRIVVPYPAGGASDAVGRAIALKLTAKLGQSFFIENRTGASGSLGATQVARAAPDGYTLLLASSSEMSIYTSVASSPPYEPLRDFTPIRLIATTPSVLTVTEGLPVNSTQELVAYSRSNPGKLNFGTAGPGSNAHMIAELFATMTKTQMTHVPYRGTGPALTDLIAGNLDLVFATVAVVLPYAQSNKIKLLAISTAKRSALMPDLPTIEESGVPGFATSMWTDLIAPAGMPTVVVDRLGAAVDEALADPDLKRILATYGAELAGGTPDQFFDEIRRELVLWKDIARQKGIRVD